MAGAMISVTIDDAALRGALKRVRGFGPAATKPMSVALVKGTIRRFRESRDPSGVPWARLHPLYAPIKRGPGILRASGLLMRSINAQHTATTAMAGTNDIRARVHQFGATIVPKTAGRLVFRLASGIVRARKVVIPARPFLGVDREDEQEMLDVVETVILSRAGGVPGRLR